MPEMWALGCGAKERRGSWGSFLFFFFFKHFLIIATDLGSDLLELASGFSETENQ